METVNNIPNISRPTCLYIHAAIYTKKRGDVGTILLIFMDPCIVDDSVEIPTRCSFVIEFIIPKFIEGSTYFERHTAHHQEL